MARKHLSGNHDRREASSSTPPPRLANASALADIIGIPPLPQSPTGNDRLETPAAQTLREIEKALGNDAHLLRELPIIHLVIRCQPGGTAEGLLDHYIDLGSIVETNAALEEVRAKQTEENTKRVGIFLRPAKTESGPPAINISYVEDMAYGLDKKDLGGCEWSSGPHGFVKSWSGDKYTAVAKYYFLKHPGASKELCIKFPISKTFITQLRAACLDCKTAKDAKSKIRTSSFQRAQILAKKTGTGRAALEPPVSFSKEDHDVSTGRGDNLQQQQQQYSGIHSSARYDALGTPPTAQATSMFDDPTSNRTSQRLVGRMRATPRFQAPPPLDILIRRPAIPTADEPVTASAWESVPPTPNTVPPHPLEHFTEYLTFALQKDDLEKSIQDDKLKVEHIDHKIQALQAERDSLKRKLSNEEMGTEKLSFKLKHIRQLMNADEAFELGQWVAKKKSEIRKENMS